MKDKWFKENLQKLFTKIKKNSIEIRFKIMKKKKRINEKLLNI